MKQERAHILYAEDNLPDVLLLREALLELNLDHYIHHVESGEDVLSFLARKGAYQEAPTPSLLLLDLNLPRKNGFEVLAELRQRSHPLPCPVAVLTTTAREQDARIAAAGVEFDFFIKPMDYDSFLTVVQKLNSLVTA